MELLHDLHTQGRTIVMVTHDPEIAEFTERTIHFRDGRIDKDLQNGNSKPIPVSMEAGHESI